jgi:hypothetical protein
MSTPACTALRIKAEGKFVDCRRLRSCWAGDRGSAGRPTVSVQASPAPSAGTCSAAKIKCGGTKATGLLSYFNKAEGTFFCILAQQAKRRDSCATVHV